MGKISGFLLVITSGLSTAKVISEIPRYSIPKNLPPTMPETLLLIKEAKLSFKEEMVRFVPKIVTAMILVLHEIPNTNRILVSF